MDELRVALGTHRSVLLAAECGYGKGVIYGHIVEGTKSRRKSDGSPVYVLFLVHGRDRVNDFDKRVTARGIDHGVLMSTRKRARHHPVQIASSDTVYRMDHRPLADLLVVDECHTAMSPTFRAVIDSYPNAKIIGCTATPMLGNGRALGVKSGGIFESMVKGPSVKELIRDGYLVGSRVMAPPAPDDLKGLKKKRTGEFDENQGAAICDTTKVIGDIVDHWKRYSSDRKTAAFGFHKKHAYDITQAFLAAGVNWAYIDDQTPDGDIHTPGTRNFIWHQMDYGDLVGVSSVGCISLGWDRPICKSLIFACKTASFPLYRQRLGRGSRPYSGYSDFLVLDHCGGLYEFPDAPFFESEVDWQLDGDPIKVSEEQRAERVAICNTPVKMPDSGVRPSAFRGVTSKDGKWLLPCGSKFSVGLSQCPYCGLILSVAPREILAEPGELQPVTPEQRREAESRLRAQSEQKSEYFDLVRLAREKNYKTGYPAIVFKSKFGHWPPRGWKQEVETVMETQTIGS